MFNQRSELRLCCLHIFDTYAPALACQRAAFNVVPLLESLKLAFGNLVIVIFDIISHSQSGYFFRTRVLINPSLRGRERIQQLLLELRMLYTSFLFYIRVKDLEVYIFHGHEPMRR